MKKIGIIFWLAVGTVILFWAGTWYLIPKLYKESTGLGAGTFGDMFGAVNALFSGLAFVGLIYTILVQKEELALQRKAINDQVKETARSADQLETQKELSNLQLAMSVVNDLIKTKQERYEKVSVSSMTRGFDYGEMAFRNIINNNKGILPYSKALDTYITLYFYILSFINSYDLTDEQKTLLQDLLRMHTVENEIKVLYLAADQNEHRLGLLSSAGL